MWKVTALVPEGGRGSSTRRVVEPHRAVNWGRRWYLVAWDVEREDWRTFRVDRIQPRTPTGPRFAPRDLPGGDWSPTSAGSRTATPARLRQPAE